MDEAEEDVDAILSLTSGEDRGRRRLDAVDGDYFFAHERELATAR